MAKSSLIGLNKGLQYPNGKPKEMTQNLAPKSAVPKKEVKTKYLVLGYLKYDEDDEDEKVWEIIESKEILYKYLKANYQWLNLEDTKIYQSSSIEEGVIHLNDGGVSAYDTLKILQAAFPDDTFEIDEVIEDNIY